MTGVTKVEHIKKVKYVWQKLRFLTKVYYIQSAYFWAKKRPLPRGLLQKMKRKKPDELLTVSPTLL